MTVLIDYKTWKLPRLTARRIADLADEIQAERRARVIREAKELALDDDAKRRVIADLERERLLADDVVLWSYSVRGTLRVFEEALKQLGNGTKADDLDINPREDYRIAVRLLGYEPIEPLKQPEGESESADPTSRPAPSGTS